MINTKSLLASALFLSVPFVAEATTYSFATVTKIAYSATAKPVVTGVLVGDTTPTSVTIQHSGSANCESLLRQSLEAPGVYIYSISWTNPAPNFYEFESCSLELKP